MNSSYLLLFLLTFVVACEAPSQGPSPSDATQTQAAAADTHAKVDKRPNEGFAAAPTIVVGDLHGDMAPLQTLLRKTGLAAGDTWTGGNRTLIQTGDVLDRGDDEREIYELLWSLQKQAEQAGGRVVLMNGNHEVMNVMGDLRYVTPGGAADFSEFELPSEPRFENVPGRMRGRLAAFLPGGEWATRLADQPVIAKVDGRLYAHGGVHLHHVEHGIDAINDEMSDWMKQGGAPPSWATAQDGPLWTRAWSGSDSPNCGKLNAMLEAAEARSLAVGHTPQREGVVSRCDGKLWLIDTGMAEHYGGPTQAVGVLVDGEVGVVR